MEKILSRVLLILNVVLIVGLLALSGLLIYTSAAKPAELFGHTAVLTEGVSGGTLCIVNCHPAQLIEGDRILYQGEDDTLQLATIKQNDGTMLSYLDSTNHLLETTSDDDRIQGLVTAENTFLGHILSTLSSAQNSKITYVCIGVGFIFCAIAIFLAYFISSKVNTPFLEDESDFSLLRSLLGDGFDQTDGSEEDDGDEEDDDEEPNFRTGKRFREAPDDDELPDEDDENAGDLPHYRLPSGKISTKSASPKEEPEAGVGVTAGRSATPFPQLARVKGGNAFAARTAAAPPAQEPAQVRRNAAAPALSPRVDTLPSGKPVQSKPLAQPETESAPRVVRTGSTMAPPVQQKTAIPESRPEPIRRAEPLVQQPVRKSTIPLFEEEDFSSLFDSKWESATSEQSDSKPVSALKGTPFTAPPNTEPGRPVPNDLPRKAAKGVDAYDMYDVITPNIDDLLSDIEKEFNDLK